LFFAPDKVKRNIDRFPADFMFELTKEEAENSRCQNGTLKTRQGYNIKYLPYAFTEQGLAMLSGILNSPVAIKVNIEIMRAFVRLRAIATIHGEFSVRLAELEKKVKTQGGSIDFILDLIDREMNFLSGRHTDAFALVFSHVSPFRYSIVQHANSIKQNTAMIYSESKKRSKTAFVAV